MKMKYFIPLFILLATALSVQAQVEMRYYSVPQQSSTLNKAKEFTKDGIVQRMPAFNVSELLTEDSKTDKSAPFRFGKDFLLAITLEDGEWHQVDDGRVWTMAFESSGALSLNFIFEDFFLPEGATLEIINEEGTAFYGPVRADAIPKKGHFMTDLIPGEKVFFYLYEPFEEFGRSTLTISRLIHAYRGFDMNRMTSKGKGNADDCNIDVACYPEYAEEAKATVLTLLWNGYEYCSGALLMSTDYSLKPYFLTAFHCLDINEDGILSNGEIQSAEDWSFKFNFKKARCNDTIPSVSTTYNGAIFRAAWNNTDFALMEINHDLSTDPNLNWLGWDRTGNTPTNGACIHHPEGDVMKISIEDDAFTTVKWGGNDSTNEYNHWGVDFDYGITQNHSSGSPLLDQNHRVVGQLHGGPMYNNPCLQTIRKYGKFNLSWTGGGTNDTRLSNWLDPINSGVTIMPGNYNNKIIGSDLLCLTNSYSMEFVPLNCTVTWSLSGTEASNFILQNNSPSANQCTITRKSNAIFSSSFFVSYLTANIIKNGVTILTKTKRLEGNSGFVCTFKEPAFSYNGVNYPAIPETPLTNCNATYVYPMGQVTLTSGFFRNKTITTSGPYNQFQTLGLETIKFSLVPMSYSTDPLIITVWDQNCDPTVTMCFYPMASPMGYSYSLHINQINGNSYEVSLIRDNEATVQHEGRSSSNILLQAEPQSWQVELYNTEDGRKVLQREIKGELHYTLNTQGLKAGVYVVKVIVEDKTLTEKINIR